MYTDCDHDDAEGNRSNPWFKPAWDADLLAQQNYLAPLCVITADIFHSLPESSPSAWTCLAAEVCLAQGRAIQHLPYICYHRAWQGFGWEDEAAKVRLRQQTQPTMLTVSPGCRL